MEVVRSTSLSLIFGSCILVFLLQRYKIESMKKLITMSVAVNNPEETFCQPDATFETVADSAFSKYRRFTLTRK